MRETALKTTKKKGLSTKARLASKTVKFVGSSYLSLTSLSDSVLPFLLRCLQGLEGSKTVTLFAERTKA